MLPHIPYLPGIVPCDLFVSKAKECLSDRAVTNPKKNSDPDPNPNEVSCRISDPDPIIQFFIY